MKARNEAKHNSVDFGFVPFSGAPKSIRGCKERLFCPFVRIWSENSKTTPNLVKKCDFHVSKIYRFGAILKRH